MKIFYIFKIFDPLFSYPKLPNTFLVYTQDNLDNPIYCTYDL